jgi:tRNA pseudouridine38-40 synthase
MPRIAPRIALGIEYDGSAFNGWQIQSGNARSVQHCIEQALSQVADHEIETICAGRTDSAVHACCQVVHFDPSVTRPMHGWVMGGNSNLPEDVNILWAKAVPDDFHARYSARSRIYRYYILNRQHRSALFRNRATWVNSPLDEVAMHTASQALIGEHDFSAFRASGCQARTAMRCISALQVTRHSDFIVIEIAANAFLHHMVRNIAGVLLRIGQGEAAVEWAGQVLASRDRREGGMTAPAQGLYLYRVDYAPDLEIPAAITQPPVPLSLATANRISC